MQYEITFITTDEKKQKNVKDTLAKHKAKIVFEHSMDRLNFAYPIKKETAGYYFSYYFETNEDDIQKIAKTVQSDKDILRFLIIKNKQDIKQLKERLLNPRGKDTREKTEKSEKTTDKESSKESTKEIKKAKKKEKVAKNTTKKKSKTVKKPASKKKATKKTVTKKTDSKQLKKKTAKKTTTKKKADDQDRMQKLEAKLDELLKD